MKNESSTAETDHEHINDTLIKKPLEVNPNTNNFFFLILITLAFQVIILSRML